MAKYDGAPLSLRHIKSEKNLEEEANEFQSLTIVTATSKVKLFKSIGAVGTYPR